jgi:hypothetical protein
MSGWWIRLLGILVLGLFSIETHAQFDLSRFLREAGNDELLMPYKAQLEFLGEEKLNSPWVHRFEFRSRTNDFNFSQEDFRFRIAPTNPAEVRANREYFRVQEQLSETKYRLALNESLLDRYELYLDWQYLLGLRNICFQQIRIIEDELTIYENSVNSLEFDYEEYLDKDQERTMLNLDIKKIDHEISKNNFKIREVFQYSGPMEQTENALIPVDQIDTLLNTVLIYDTTHLKIQEAEQKLALENVDLKLEKARDRRNLGYFQTEYDRDRGNDVNDHLGFQVAVRIPLSNPDRPDQQRSMFDFLEEQFDSEQEKKWLQIQRMETSLDLQHLFSQYRFLRDRLTFLNETGIQTQGDDPLFVLRSLENRTKLQRSLLKVKYAIYERYLRFLDLHGLIIESPLRNYLNPDLEIVDES